MKINEILARMITLQDFREALQLRGRRILLDWQPHEPDPEFWARYSLWGGEPVVCGRLEKMDTLDQQLVDDGYLILGTNRHLNQPTNCPVCLGTRKIQVNGHDPCPVCG